MMVTLKYIDPSFIYGNYGNFNFSTRFRLNSVYDPDPHVTTGGTITYFSQYAAMYTRYRVISVRYSVVASNLLAEPAIFTVAPSKEDLGDNYAQIQNLAEVNKGSSQMMGANGSMNKCSVRNNINLAVFAGFPGYLTDDTTAARVDTNPSVQYYLNIGVTSNVLQSAASFGIRTELYYTVVFFQPKTDTPVVVMSSHPQELCTEVGVHRERPANVAQVVNRSNLDSRSQSQERSFGPRNERYTPPY